MDADGEDLKSGGDDRKKRDTTFVMAAIRWRGCRAFCFALCESGGVEREKAVV